MKKNNLLPILLVAGAGVAAYMYFKKKGAAKEMAEGIDVEPQTKKSINDDQNTTTSEESEPGESKAARLIKTASSIYKGARQVFKGRKKRKSRVIIEPTESSSTPFPDMPGGTRKQRRTTRRTARKVRRTSRKQNSNVAGFDDLSVLF